MSKDTLIRIDKLGRALCEHCEVKLDVADFHAFEEIECPECGKITTVPGKLGDYTLLRELGRGGMGSVFLARDAQLGRKVALKVLHARYGKNPVFVDTLLREAKAAATLNHRNIVHIFSFGQVYEQPYIVMELIDGIRLDECLKAEVETDEDGWLGIMEQICNALIAAQIAGLVHGDIKPANILLNEQGVAKLSDFGIARFEGDQHEKILGTPLYIAPEKSKGHTVDHRADQFSLGVTFWHLLTKQPPYHGADTRAIVLNRFEIPPPDPRAVAPEISQGCAELLMRMMALNPEDRFADFRAVRRRIQEVIDENEEARLLQKAEAEQQALAAKAEAEALALHARQKRNLRLAAAICVLAIVIYALL